MLKKLLKDPLLHFLLFGALLFLLYASVSNDDAGDGAEITVSAAKIQQLASLYERTWQHSPSATELQGVVDDWLREEVAYREALRLGLERNDTVVRRRLRQKLEFLAEDAGAGAEPSDQDLEDFLNADPERFYLPARFSFRQVYLRAERGAALADAARELLALLQNDVAVDASTLGDSSLLQHRYADVSEQQIARLLGSDFAQSLASLQPGSWQGPIQSAYGFHLVIVDERKPGYMPGLEQLRPELRREWQLERRRNVLQAFYDDLLQRYTIRVEWPPAEQSGVR